MLACNESDGTIQRTVSVTIKPTTAEIADAIWNLDTTLSDEEIEHKIDYLEMYRTSMDNMNRERNVHDADTIDKHFEKRVW